MSIVIYCSTCREPVLRTSPKFKAGGPYTGDMFESYKNCTRYADDFNFGDWVNSGNLWCPRCLQNFIQGDEILTEHGRIRVGQTEIDESVSVVYKDGELADMLKSPGIYNQPEETPKLFVCEVCGKDFTHKIALTGHMRSHQKCKKQAE